MSAWSHRPLSLVRPMHRSARETAATRAVASATVPAIAPSISAIHEALGPEERLLAVLQGADLRGPVCWVITPRRLIVLPVEHANARHTAQIAQVSHAAVMYVDLRSDPLGTTLRIRATGRQLTMQTLDAAEATDFCSLLRERAGIGPARAALPAVAAPRPRRTFDTAPQSTGGLRELR